MRAGCIYSLNDPVTNEIRYIGQTIVKPRNRYAQHIYQWKRSIRLTHLNAWIKSLHTVGLKPVMMIILNNISISNLDDREIKIIDKYRKLGCQLCNHTVGGKSLRGYKPSDEAKQKRLTSLKTSTAWKEKHIRHSEIMRDKYKTGVLLPPALRISKENREKANKAISEGLNRRNKIKLLEIDSGKILLFNGQITLAKYLGYQSSNGIRDFLHNKRKTHLHSMYRVLENQTKVRIKKRNNTQCHIQAV